MAYFRSHFQPDIGVRIHGGIDAFLAAPRSHIEDPANPQWAPGNFREILGESWPTRRHSRRPSFRAPIAVKGGIFPESFPPRYRGAYKWANVDVFLAAFRPQIEGPVNSQRMCRNFRGILEESWEIRRRSRRPSFWTIIAAKVSISGLSGKAQITIGTGSKELRHALWARRSVLFYAPQELRRSLLADKI